jgi:hypothetical protein
LVQITIEYMIMTPVLIMMIFLLPFTASLIMNGWVDSRRALTLQETGGYLGSSMQQFYSSLSHESVKVGIMESVLNTPRFIEGYVYTGNATFSSVSAAVNSSRVLQITLSFIGNKITTTTSVTLGSNVQWTPSTFMSNSTTCLKAEKMSNGTIRFWFGDDQTW